MSQASQMSRLREALTGLRRVPTEVVHGAQDDFAPLAAARALAEELDAAGARVSFRTVQGDHFLTRDPPDQMLAHIEEAIAGAERAGRLRHRWNPLAGLARRVRREPAPTLQTELA